jgi:hypothetical protein
MRWIYLDTHRKACALGYQGAEDAWESFVRVRTASHYGRKRRAQRGKENPGRTYDRDNNHPNRSHEETEHADAKRWCAAGKPGIVLRCRA